MVVLTGLAVWGLAAQTSAPALPAGRGRAQLQRVCGMCHGIEVVTKMRAGKEQWSEIVDDMVSKGATGTSDDFELVVQYLASNFGPVTGDKVEINKTSADQLVAALGMSQAEASAIIRYRTEHGAFREWSELSKVVGVDLKQHEENRDKIVFSVPAFSVPATDRK